MSSNIGFPSQEKGSFQYSVGAELNFLKTLKNESETLDDKQRLRTTQSYIFRSSYAISDKFEIELFFPIVRQTRRITTNLGEEDREATFGFGDPAIILMYQIFKSDVTGRLGIGPQIPLGSTNRTNAAGITLLEDLQPGSGAWDIIAFSSFEFPIQNRPSALIFLNSIYTLTGTNPDSRNGLQSYTFGNDFQIILGFSDQYLLLNHVINPGLSFRYRNASKDRVNDHALPGTGGEFIFARITNNIPFAKSQSSLNLNFEFPIFARVNDTQLSPSYIINIGWHKTIDQSADEDLIIDIN